MFKKVVVGAVASIVLLGACSASSTNFKKKAEELSVKIFKDQGITATSNCDEPASTDVGTTFDCTAKGDDGSSAKLLATISKKNFVQVTVTATDGAPDAATDTTVATDDTTSDEEVSPDETSVDETTEDTAPVDTAA